MGAVRNVEVDRIRGDLPVRAHAAPVATPRLAGGGSPAQASEKR